MDNNIDDRQNRLHQADQPEQDARKRYLNYNRPEYYNIKRREFGHGESGNLNPGLMERYGERSFRGYSQSPATGRDYEENIGYRQAYERLGGGDREPGGTNRGKGPRTYRRPDERIMEDINDRLCDNPYIDASEVDVTVSNGDVILTGTVDNREAKRLAADIGESVSGVTNVENRLRVRIKGI